MVGRDLAVDWGRRDLVEHQDMMGPRATKALWDLWDQKETKE